MLSILYVLESSAADQNPEIFRWASVYKEFCRHYTGDQKQLKVLNNNITQTKCYGKHCLSISCYLVYAILLFTLFKFEIFEDRLSL